MLCVFHGIYLCWVSSVSGSAVGSGCHVVCLSRCHGVRAWVQAARAASVVSERMPPCNGWHQEEGCGLQQASSGVCGVCGVLLGHYMGQAEVLCNKMFLSPAP